MKSPLSFLLFLLLAGWVAAKAPNTQDYTIKFTRTATVGERYRVISQGSDEQYIYTRINDQEQRPRGEGFQAELIADCEVLALTQTGRETKTRLVVEKFTRTASGQTVELLPAGAIVLAERVGNKTVFTTDGSEATPVVVKALEVVGVSMAGDDGADDDTIFGTTGRKKIGEAWPINGAAAAADLVKLGIPAEAANVTGTTTLVEVVTQENQELLRLSATLKMTGVNPPVPPGFTVQSSLFTSEHSGLFPVDLTKRSRLESTALNFEVAVSGTQNGQPVVMTMSKKGSREVKFIR